MNRNMMVLLALTAALVLPACSGDGGGSLATTPKIEPPPVSWNVEALSVAPAPGSTVAHGRAVTLSIKYSALSDAEMITGLFDANGRNMDPGGELYTVRPGTFNSQVNAWCGLHPGRARVFKVAIGTGQRSFTNVTFSQPFGHWEFNVDYICK